MFALGPVRLQFAVLSIDCPPALFDQMGSQSQPWGGAFLGSTSTSSVLTPLLRPFPLSLSLYLTTCNLAQYSSASVEQSRVFGD